MTSISFGGTSSGFQLGVNHGQIILPAERGKPRAKPISTVPLPRDPDFVSRDALLEQIHKKALISGSRIALVGLGGVGKTQLAVEYCHQIQQQSPDTWVLWVHASNVARCEKSLRELADRAKIPHDHNANIFQVVGTWLQDEVVGQWVLVLDNVDDDELLRKPLTTESNNSTQPPLRYLLQNSNGSIIVTSRNKGVALNIARHSDIIEVQPMNEAEALNLLQRKLSTSAEQQSMIQLVKALDYMPLAIVQAGAYITHHMPRCSVLEYFEKVQKSDRKAARLLDYEAGLLYRDWEAKNSVLLTWQISFDYIKQKQPSAADLLSLMSFFDRQGIQESHLRHQKRQENNTKSHLETHEEGSSEDEETSSESEADDHLNEDLTTLSHYSLITVGEDNSIFTMHRLVQVTVRAWLKLHGQLEQWKEQFIYYLYSEFPTAEYENWEKCRSLFPHIKSAESQPPNSIDSIQQWTSLLYRGAWYALDSGYIAEARAMAYKSRDYRQKAYGAEDEDTLASSAILADAYRQEGRWDDAEQLEVQVMEISKKKFGVDHYNTLMSVANLASTYWNQGRWDEAEQLDIQVMEARKLKLGVNHPDTVTSMANLASTYWDQGRWDEAEQLEIQVMEACKLKLGENHPDTLLSMANIAATYRKQGCWDEAEQLDIQVMEARKLKLGVDHPDTLSSMASLAATYRKQSRWDEAEQLDVKALETRKTKLGADHPDTLVSMANLAFTWQSTGRSAEAIDLLQTCVTKQQRKLGPTHPHTLYNSETLLGWQTKQLSIEE